tara:strand:- start:4853 stop:5692 length:840 start_codon:yes stop_codon:yes gene_type:complete
MAAKFWFYPEQGRLLEIDLGEDLGELFFDFEYEEETNTSLVGGMYRTVTMSRQAITIQRDRLKLGEGIGNKLRSMENHLNRGLSVSFCSDHTKAFCYPLRNATSTGSTSINVLGDPFYQMTGGGSVPVSGDYVAIETKPINAKYEVQKFTSTSGAFSAANGGRININEGTAFRYDRPAFLRYYRFWPILKRASDVGSSIITNENGLLFSLSIKLVVDPLVLWSFHPLEDNQTSTINYNLGQPNVIDSESNIFGSFGSNTLDSNGIESLEKTEDGIWLSQ